MRTKALWLAVIIASAAASSFNAMAEESLVNLTSPGCTPVYDYLVTNIYPHDRTAFTQGLAFDGQDLYEGTGLYGCSTLRQVDLKTGRLLRLCRMPAEFFGEGITIWKNMLIQLTWRSMIGFVYDKDNLTLLGNFSNSREGWGITNDGQRLIASDGSDVLFFLDPNTFEDQGSVRIRDKLGPIFGLNELEYVKGLVYANLWQTSRIAIISPGTGEVKGWIDLRALVNRENSLSKVDVLNGIAYDADRDLLLVTGKYWPELFEIKLLGKNKSDGC